jgi:hypothetical protein
MTRVTYGQFANHVVHLFLMMDLVHWEAACGYSRSG